MNYLLEPASFRLDGGAMFGIIPRPLWQKVAPPDELNRIDLALRLWLIKTTDKIILVDTGIGSYHDKVFNQRFDVRGPSSPLKDSLALLKLEAEDITDLVISHLHFDHIGGLGEEGKTGIQVVFPNAQVHLHQDHYQYALNPTERDSGSFHVSTFDPLLQYYKERDQLHFYSGQEGKLLDLENGNQLKFKCSHGHTPWLLHPYDDQFIYMADLVPTSHHVSIPWVMGYDIQPGITTKDKKEFYKFIEEKNLSMIFEHDPNFWGAKLGKDKKGRATCLEKFAVSKESAYLLSNSL
jgi:glyoxylase-like metal-dependent hydrolase (beta-lactamase superfamily II)